MGVHTMVREQMWREHRLLICGCGATGYAPDYVLMHPSAYVALRSELVHWGYPDKLQVDGLNVLVCGNLPEDTLVIGRAITVEYFAIPERGV